MRRNLFFDLPEIRLEAFALGNPLPARLDTSSFSTLTYIFNPLESSPADTLIQHIFPYFQPLNYISISFNIDILHFIDHKMP